MDAFMLNAHENDPHVSVPVELCLLSFLYDVDDHLLNFISVNFSLLDGRPFVMRLTEIIPVHFIDSNSEHSFIRFIDSFSD